MKVLVIGANGQIGQFVIKKLQESNMHNAIAMVRNKKQQAKFEEQGVESVLVDLEGSISDIASAAKRTDAIVYTAGSGGHTGADKTMMIDLDGAIKSMEAAKQVGVKRFIIVSAIGVHHRDLWMNSAPYYSAAKFYADKWLEQSGLDYTIIRPGSLSNDSGTGRINVADTLELGQIPREDVASTIVTSLELPHTIGKAFDMTSGELQIKEALKKL